MTTALHRRRRRRRWWQYSGSGRALLFRHRSPPDGFSPKRVVVLICLFEDDDSQLRVILTKRSYTFSTHSGEVALPGEKAEEGDADDKETTLRESKEEEIGLDPSLVTVVAILEPFLSKHLLRVSPVIVMLSDKKTFKPIINIVEVDTLLEMFLKEENRWSVGVNGWGINSQFIFLTSKQEIRNSQYGV